MPLYNEKFFADLAPGSLRSARTVAPLVVDLIKPESIIDVGCGAGAWAAAFREHGIGDVVGVDGDYVDRERLLIPIDQFIAADLAQGVPVGRKFDLAVCLEVAEHLPTDRSQLLVAELTRLAPVVLFSAAIPHQGGTGHVNERWQDEWAAMFDQHGFQPVDVIRPRIWDDPNVDFWYAQNALLYTTLDRSLEITDPRASWPLRVVHPRLYELQHTPHDLSERVAGLAGRARRLLLGAT